MNMTEIKSKARNLGVQVGRLPKKDLIRSIQNKEGNFPCFATAKDYCSQKLCCWRDACLPTKKKSLTAWEKRKKTYTEKLTAQLADLKKEITDLKKRTKTLVGKGKEEAVADINKIELKMAELKKKSQKLADATEDAWKIKKKALDDMRDDLNKTFKKTVKKLK